MRKITLTYSPGDAELANEIVEILELVGYAVRRDALGKWRAAQGTGQVGEAARDADFWVVLLSDELAKLGSLPGYFDTIRDDDLFTVAVQVKPLALPAAVKERLAGIPAVGLERRRYADPDHRYAAFKQLLEALRLWQFGQIRRAYEAKVKQQEEDNARARSAVLNDSDLPIADKVTSFMEIGRRDPSSIWEEVTADLAARKQQTEASQAAMREEGHSLADDVLLLLDLKGAPRPLSGSERLVERVRRLDAFSFDVPGELYKRLHETLARCEQFSSNSSLGRVFSDERLSEWEHRLPEADSVSGRIDSAIHYLRNQRNVEQESALVLLLQVLGEKYGSGDDLHGRLVELAAQLESARLSQILKVLGRQMDQVTEQNTLLYDEWKALQDFEWAHTREEAERRKQRLALIQKQAEEGLKESNEMMRRIFGVDADAE